MSDDIRPPQTEVPLEHLTPYPSTFEVRLDARYEHSLCRVLWFDASDLAPDSDLVTVGITEYGPQKTGPRRHEMVLSEHAEIQLKDAVRLARCILDVARRFGVPTEEE